MRTLRDAIYGVAVGDALGSPVQFMERGSYPKVTEMLYCRIFKKKAGTWTDDTSLTLALCDSIKQCGAIDTEDIYNRFRSWLEIGKYTQDGRAFDVGRTCFTAIATHKGKDDIKSNGNGSLMRIVPLAFVEGISDRQIEEVSAVTHAHAISREACRIYVHIAMDLKNGASLQDAVDENVRETSSVFERLSDIKNCHVDEIKSTGYVVDTLEASLWCLLNTSSFRDALETAVNLGGDTDTIGAVTGGLAGIFYGIEGIPEEWIKALRKPKMIERCLFV